MFYSLFKTSVFNFQIHVIPLEDLSKYKTQNVNNARVSTRSEQETQECLTDPPEPLSRALKRKFTELDEITQRLRLRLSKVVEDDSDASSDGLADQFEKDLNTLSIEEDFDLVNFEENEDNINVMQTIQTMEQQIVDSNLLMTDVVEKDDNCSDVMASGSSQVRAPGTSSGETVISSK